jgi:hypothetical protein
MAKNSPLVVLSGDENVGDSTGTTVTDVKAVKAVPRNGVPTRNPEGYRSLTITGVAITGLRL